MSWCTPAALQYFNPFFVPMCNDITLLYLKLCGYGCSLTVVPVKYKYKHSIRWDAAFFTTSRLIVDELLAKRMFAGFYTSKKISVVINTFNTAYFR